ncbi:MAG: M23 family metallopeptidase [Clostridia bacterium]|nr:M23 family metallopeptidase [Clostridia bacterium]
MPRIVTGKSTGSSGSQKQYSVRPEITRQKRRYSKNKPSKFLRIVVSLIVLLHLDGVVRGAIKLFSKFADYAYTSRGINYRVNKVHIRYTNYFYRLRYYIKHGATLFVYGISGLFRLIFPVAAPIAGTAMLVFSVWVLNTYAIALEVSVGNESIGYISNEQEYYSIQRSVEERIETDGHDDEYITENIPLLTLSFIRKDEVSDSETIVNTLYETYCEYIGQSYGYFIDGQFVGTSKNEADLDSVLSEIVKPYLSGEEDEAYYILNSIEVVRDEYPREYEKTTSELLALFIEALGSDTYTVKKGDTLESIASKYSLDVPVLRLINGNISEDYLTVGMKLNVKAPKVTLSVQTTRTVTYTEVIPYETKYIYSSSLYENIRETKQNGSNGMYEVTAEISSVNGVEVGREVVDKKKTKDAIAKQVLVGTKTIAPSGTFIWPVSMNGYQLVTSRFGARTLRGKYDFHRGYDIACEYGTKIFAADAGTIIKKGWQEGGLGNYIAIDHGNGIVSYYGHCSSLEKSIKIGDKVYQGQVIAYVGSTGNSTGNHVHFALFNKETGSYFDPEPYLEKP